MTEWLNSTGVRRNNSKDILNRPPNKENRPSGYQWGEGMGEGQERDMGLRDTNSSI